MRNVRTMKTLVAFVLMCHLAAGQTQPKSLTAVRHMPVLVDSIGSTVGEIVPSSSEYHTASVVLRDEGKDLLVGVVGHRTPETDKPLSTGLMWGVGTRAFAGPNCTAPEYIAVGGGANAIGERLTLVYLEAGQYILAVGKRSIGNMSGREFSSFMDPLGSCKSAGANLLSVEVDRRIPLKRFGDPPFFLK